MKKRKKLLTLLIVLIFTIVTPISFADSSDNISDNTSIKVQRISGGDRYETSTAVAKEIQKNSNYFYYTILASGENFPDALSAGSLASELGVPLLLTEKKTIPQKVVGTIDELQIGKLYLVGGENSVGKEIEKQISEVFRGTKIERIYGKNRLFTAISVAEKIREYRRYLLLGETVATYNSNAFSDALSAAPFMYQYNKQFKNGYSLPLLPFVEVENNYFPGIYIAFGGKNSIPNDADVRLSGSDRYKTAVEVAKAYKTMLKMDIDTIVLVDGENYPDALTSTPLASKQNAAVLLTKSDKLNVDTKEYIKSNPNIKNIIIVGGENSVSKDIEQELLNIRQ
ncbi:cell wall-binding repeat-containing protein [Peptostreptococcus sp. D1]|uniref:cell wall-binding repeat-containing protein n=1 Tax=Peptostreptococcus sp. D1 TaxID=72304 RepID=UPI0008E61F40|nr:cell wall-binding repeat-containing protein [Peptostreptococcus sp. D1]SFE68688.1 Putative cell wall-binding protein [Peptostreptococcus sp. D1]